MGVIGQSELVDHGHADDVVLEVGADHEGLVVCLSFVLDREYFYGLEPEAIVSGPYHPC